MTHAIILLAAYVLDRLIGDPRALPHPVIYMGKCITWLERRIRADIVDPRTLKTAGVLLPMALVGGSYLIVWLILKGSALIHPWLSWGIEAWLISTTIAAKGLADAGMDIHKRLDSGDIGEARRALAMVVGRDTDALDERDISRAAVETVAENIVDAVVSPLFYAVIGGAPLAMAYRAVNTLDSMVGYKNERYEHLGWASARLDDLANYLPARLAALLLVMASGMRGLNWRGAWRVMRRDARRHPSPNSGWTEAGVAGALGIQLGGTNYYQGVPSHRAKMGDQVRVIQLSDIAETVSIMKLLSTLFLIGCAAATLMIS
jgi:adenosylcobinamide-phosphate synthase